MKIGKLLFYYVIACVIGAAAAVFAFKVIEPKFYVEASVLVNPGRKSLLTPDIASPLTSMRRTELYNKLAYLQSDSVINSVADELIAYGYVPFLSELIGRKCCEESSLSDLKPNLRYSLKKRILTHLDRNANLVRLNISTSYPDQGGKLLQSVLSAWMKAIYEDQKQESMIMLETLEQGVEAARVRSEDARNNLETFLRHNPKLASDQLIQQIFLQSSTLNQQITEATSELSGLQTNFNVFNSQSMQDRIDAQLDPRQSQIVTENLHNLFQKEIARIPEITRQTARLRSLLDLAQAEKFEIDKEKDRIPPLLARLALIRSDFETTTSAYFDLMTAATKFRVELNDNSIGITILSQPASATEPYFPKLPVFVVVGAAMAIVLTTITLFFSHLNRRYYEPGAIAGLRTAGVIGHMPSLSSWRLRRRHTWKKMLIDGINGAMWQASPDFDRIIRVAEMSLSQPVRTISVSSYEVATGKSSVSFGLAAAINRTKANSVLLVDLDLRKKTGMLLDKQIEAEPITVGQFAGVLSKFRAVFEDVVVIDVLSMTTPTTTSRDLQTLINHLNDGLFTRYEKIIFDTPPIQFFVDAIEIAKSCDVAFLVAREGKTLATNLSHVYSEMLLAGCSRDRIWTVLNDSKQSSRSILKAKGSDYLYPVKLAG